MKKQLKEYNNLFENIVKTIEYSKLKVYSQINTILLECYWSIGKELSKNAKYGKSVVVKLSEDLRLRFPGIRGYSVSNLWNMKRFYEAYSKLQSVIGGSGLKIQTVSGEFKKVQPVATELFFRRN
ncbi:MAG: hypothetical protein KKA65_02025 [Nanoarchaeota archaeon]|nr:hypothetical protein [Nanoarchaeota archaeon]MBU4241937.1 hypothetical protein [Nanoarchaeota archaeon]MBU4351681.1 hypothetical protein [Nanoarchaeota archaeon]MBU4456255.1 hypothetical protein [Nanoarchaeota archaeon]